MSTPSNLYAEKVFAEHPIGLWALDDNVDYISNQIKTIYTKNINYLVSANRTKTLKTNDMADVTNEFYIDTRIVDNELLSMKLKVSKVNQNELLF